ncbi:Single-stranded DNA-binding protein why1, chloroplastic [Castilleja foliolosa]|uniref:Single-stranded DNA-binding protein why1, chloroplastic n=1 Tax=Castilleja foliolosa TaxID=1961234 RepID=A0ABD3CLB2_9LAMI
MASFSLCGGGDGLFSGTRNANFITNPLGNHSRNFSFSVKSQYLKPQEPQQRLSSYETPSSQPGSGAGFVLLQFAPAVGVRQYGWGRKQVFSLSVTEIGNIISLGAKGSCEFFHDPNKGRSDEGKVRKVLKVEPLPDGSGHFFNLSVQNKLVNVDESIYIPITKADSAVLVSSFIHYTVPLRLVYIHKHDEDGRCKSCKQHKP